VFLERTRILVGFSLQSIQPKFVLIQMKQLAGSESDLDVASACVLILEANAERAFYVSVRICYMVCGPRCRRESVVGLRTTCGLAKRMWLRSADFLI